MTEGQAPPPPGDPGQFHYCLKPMAETSFNPSLSLPPLQDNYRWFCELDGRGLCYHFQVSLSGPALELHNCMAKLLSHPLQRPYQSHASYSLLEGDGTPEAQAAV